MTKIKSRKPKTGKKKSPPRRKKATHNPLASWDAGWNSKRAPKDKQ